MQPRACVSLARFGKPEYSAPIATHFHSLAWKHWSSRWTAPSYCEDLSKTSSALNSTTPMNHLPQMPHATSAENHQLDRASVQTRYSIHENSSCPFSQWPD